MERLNEILIAVSFAAECLRADRWERQIPQILERLGLATDVDRVYVFENHQAADGTLLTSQRYEWAASSVEPQINNPELQNLVWSDVGIEDWMEQLTAGNPVVALTENLPEPKYSLLRTMQGIISIVLVPIFIGNEPWGYTGFDDCTREREWNSSEINALRAGANILGAFLQRERLRKALEEIKTLQGILPICAHCKIIRDNQGDWKAIEDYIRIHSDAEFSHGICPECAGKHY